MAHRCAGGEKPEDNTKGAQAARTVCGDKDQRQKQETEEAISVARAKLQKDPRVNKLAMQSWMTERAFMAF